MLNSEKPIRFKDKIIRCGRCRRVFGKQVADGQLLILESSGLAVFNWLRGRCLNDKCNKVLSWESPNLIDDLLPDKLQDFPPEQASDELELTENLPSNLKCW